jgi:hypothetical protein
MGEQAFLTEEEHEILDLTSKLAERVRAWLGDGPAARGDWAELAGAIHVVQRQVLSNAAARAYPGRYRMAGRTFGDAVRACGTSDDEATAD